MRCYFDHSKNFPFLMDKQGEWRLAPAYDLTCSAGIHGEHTTFVAGEGEARPKRILRRNFQSICEG